MNRRYPPVSARKKAILTKRSASAREMICDLKALASEFVNSYGLTQTAAVFGCSKAAANNIRIGNTTAETLIKYIGENESEEKKSE